MLDKVQSTKGLLFQGVGSQRSWASMASSGGISLVLLSHCDDSTPDRHSTPGAYSSSRLAWPKSHDIDCLMHPGVCGAIHAPRIWTSLYRNDTGTQGDEAEIIQFWLSMMGITGTC